MEEFLQAYEGEIAKPSPDWDGIIRGLRGLKDAQLIVKSQPDVLEVTNPVTHTIPWLFILTARAKTAEDDEPRILINYIEKFVASFDPIRARQVPERVTMLCGTILRLVDLVRANPILAVGLMTPLVQKYVQKGHLNPVTVLYLRACLSARHYTLALSMISHPIVSLEPLLDSNVQDWLLYHYYSGLVFCGLQKWQQALDSLCECIVTPAYAASQIQIDAWKKWTLVSLILDGEVKFLPKFVSHAVSKTFKTQSPYNDLVSHFANANFDGEKYRQALAHDGNAGLLEHVMDAHKLKVLTKMTKTYHKIMLKDFERNSVFRLDNLVNMIQEEKLLATIDLRQGLVEFHDAKPPKNIVQSLFQKIEEVQRLNADVRQADEAILVSREWAMVDKRVYDEGK